MSEKLDKLIKECDDFFNSQFTKYETDYKSFIDTYNTAITRTESYDGNVGDKVWPRDFFPDKPNIKTYGDFYKWLFNIEYGSVFYNEKDVNTSYSEYIDPVTGENEKNRRVTPVGGSGADFNVPKSLKDKIDSNIIQKPIYKELRSKYDNIQVYNKYKLAKEITAEKFSKKVLEVILANFPSNTILTKWKAATPGDNWYNGLNGKTPYSHNDIGIINIVSREYPFKQDYYGGTFWFFIDNPWSKTSAIYDALIESINESKNNLITGSQSSPEFGPQPVEPVKEIKIDPLNVSGKIILKVKSGPGLMIGETEKNIVGGFSIFKDIQFDKPGDYVISVTSTSPDTEETEFKIKVTPEPDVIPQDESRGKEEVISGNRPIIAQIDQPTIKLPPMEFDKKVNDDNAGLVADSIGAMPFVNYMGSPIQDRDIENLKIYHDGIVPKCKITFIDSQNLMKTVGEPQEDSNFEVFINAKSNNLKSIHLKFKVEMFKNSGNGLYIIQGTLDVDLLYRINYKNMTGTSFEVIRNLCKEIGLGFNSNILNTNDSMTWKFNGKKNYESISDIIKHSYISDSSFMAGYIDYYYCFNYVDVEKESIRDISKDVGVETGVDKIDTISKVVNLQLINEPSMNKSCFYFSQYTTQNNATELAIKTGNSTIIKGYDRSKKTMEIFYIDAFTSDGSKSLILKGSKYDKDAFNNNVTTKYMGKMDSDNVHKNYLYAPELNQRNLNDLNKLQMNLVLSSHNLNLYKLQKINVSVLNLVPTVTAPEKILWRQSGDWIISDIVFKFSKESGTKKVFTQEILLIRKELGKTMDEIAKDQPVEKKDENNDKVNTNPEPVAPNSVYQLGDIYRVKDSKGKEYWISIKALTDEGNGVFGELTSLQVFDDKIDTKTTETQTAKVVTPPLDSGLTPVVLK